MVILSGCETERRAVMIFMAWLKRLRSVRVELTRFMMALTYASYATIAFEIWKARAHWSDLAMT